MTPKVDLDKCIMNILHIAPSVGMKSFGVGVVALNLAKEQFAQGCNTCIWCNSTKNEVNWAAETSRFDESRITRFPYLGPKLLQWTPYMEYAAFSGGGSTFNVLHQHGIWHGGTRATNVIRQKYGIPYVVAPHGSLSPWALDLSRWKKKIGMATYVGKNLRHASCLHATADSEINDFRDYGLTNPIAVIYNGTSKQSLQVSGDNNRFRTKFNIPKEKRIVLFLSRITPKKGLPMLLEAVKTMGDNWHGWLLVIAGTDEFGHKSEVETIVKRDNLSDKVRIIGPLFGQEKDDGFAAADLFILPSYSDGAPIVILDSLAAGVPVIATKACPWEEIEVYDCGWWVDINAEAIRTALYKAIEHSQVKLRAKGQKGKELVASMYTWSKLSEKTIELYQWLLQQREKPDFVLLD